MFKYQIVSIICLGLGLFSCQSKLDLIKPNIVLIITDDQGYGDIGAHGNPDINTPNIDKLFTQSTRLTDFHVSPTCAPSRAALLTGRYANRTGVWHTIAGRSLLTEGEVTLPEVLRNNGYTTGLFGKWHLGDNYPFRPEDRGFDEVVSHLGGGVGQQHDFWDNNYFDDVYYHNGKQEQYEGYCTDVWFNEATRFINEKSQTDEPFFAYISTNAPHGPFNVSNQYADVYKDNPNVVNAAFNGMISNVDDNVGKLTSFLDEKGLTENTIFIFMTDNGTASGHRMGPDGLTVKGYNAGMRGMKGSEYEGGHRVPFYIKWPKGGLIEGQEIKELTAHIDIFPTILSLVGIEYEETDSLDGQNLAALFFGKEINFSNRVIVTDSQRKEFPEKLRKSATMQGKWRLINGMELYNIEEDPGQQIDLKVQEPEKFKQLTAGYDAWWMSIKPSFENTPRIKLCHSSEPITLLRAHDLHLDEEEGHFSVPWNAKLMRSGFKTNGYYSVEIIKNGRYQFDLMRWPPEVNVAMTEGLPAKKGLPGTTIEDLKKGVALPIKKGKIKIGDMVAEKDVDPSSQYVSFQFDLKKGPIKLQAWFKELDDVPYASNFVRVSSVE
ncbi:MAG: arylsulfatase [Reichenbachiella sp.]